MTGLRSSSEPARLAALRRCIARLERPAAPGVVGLGVAAIDSALPGGGLARGAVHEILGAGGDEEDGAVPAAFAAAIAARLALQQLGAGTVLWCQVGAFLEASDLYAPGIAAQGLDPTRLVLAACGGDGAVLWAMEEGLRTPGLAAVIGEIGRLPMVAGRRLQLAAERSGVTGLMLRRWRSGAEAARERPLPSAAATRWRVAALPAAPLAGLRGVSLPGIGLPRWRVELLRCRGGAPAAWEVTVTGPGELAAEMTGAWEVADAADTLSLPAELADRAAPYGADGVPGRRAG